MWKKMLRHIVRCEILICCFIIALFSQSFQTLQVGFTRTVTSDEKVESAQGEIHSDGVKTTIIISDPLSQWMRMEGNKVLIYYPEEKRALQLTSQGPVRMTFFQAFTGLIKENFGLPESGFTLEKNELRSDTLWAYWLPPESMRKYLGHFIIALQKGRYIKVQITTNQEKILGETVFNNHIRFNGYYFPLHITTTQYSENSATVETVVFQNPVFDKPLQEQILNFQVPSDITVEEMQW